MACPESGSALHRKTHEYAESGLSVICSGVTDTDAFARPNPVFSAVRKNSVSLSFPTISEGICSCTRMRK